MSPDYHERVGQVDWHSLDPADRTGDRIEKWLVDLVSPDRRLAIDAVNGLWDRLTHQRAYITPTAGPAFPFLLEVAKGADDILLVELLDVFWGMACCSRPPASAWPTGGAWVAELRGRLLAARPWFEALTRSANEDVAFFAAEVVACLDDPATSAEPREAAPAADE